jgi:hypothetical protein
VKKEPAQQRLKTRGLSVDSRIPPPRPPTGTVAAPPHQIALGLAEQGIETFQGLGLGIGSHHLHHLLMQGLGAGRTPAALQAMVQLPYRIPQPGQLQGAEFGAGGLGGQPHQPTGAV